MRERNSRVELKVKYMCEKNRDIVAESVKMVLEAREAKAAEQAKAAGLPALRGCDQKQVSWAVMLRKQFLDVLTEKAKSSSDDFLPEIIEINKKRILAHTDAQWFINVRRFSRSADSLLGYLGEEPQVVAPKKPLHTGSVSIQIEGNEVRASYDRNEHFREIVKEIDFTWDTRNRYWSLEADETTGEPIDVASDLANRLLAGFMVVASTAIIDRAVNGYFKPRHLKRIWFAKSGKEPIFRMFPKGDNEMYQRMRSLPGAEWNTLEKSIDVPKSSWDAIMDFSNAYGFKLTSAAKNLAETEAMNVVRVDPVPVKKSRPKAARPEASESGIIPDLMDPE